MIAKRKKQMLALFVMLITLMSNMTAFAIPVSLELEPQADMSIGIQPFWANVSDIVVGLSITNGKAVLSASVEGYSGVTKITAVAVLERLNANGTYTEIERWSNISANNRWLDWTATRYVATGHTYRFTFTATATRNGVSETVSGSISRPA